MKHFEALQLGPGIRLDLHLAAILDYHVWDGRKGPPPKSATSVGPFVMITDDGLYRYGVESDGDDEMCVWEPSRRLRCASDLFIQHDGYMRYERMSDILRPGAHYWRCSFVRGLEYSVSSKDPCLAIVRARILHDMTTRERIEVEPRPWPTKKSKKKSKKGTK